MKRVITRAHQPPDREPIVLSPGDGVVVGELFAEDPEWPGWVWCTSRDSGASGWVPKPVLEIAGANGTAKEPYTSHELAAGPGETVTVHRHLNGWAWCSNASGETGWVPDRNLEG